jgi:hypothetical protein
MGKNGRHKLAQIPSKNRHRWNISDCIMCFEMWPHLLLTEGAAMCLLKGKSDDFPQFMANGSHAAESEFESEGGQWM